MVDWQMYDLRRGSHRHAGWVIPALDIHIRWSRGRNRGRGGPEKMNCQSLARTFSFRWPSRLAASWAYIQRVFFFQPAWSIYSCIPHTMQYYTPSSFQRLPVTNHRLNAVCFNRSLCLNNTDLDCTTPVEHFALRLGLLLSASSLRRASITKHIDDNKVWMHGASDACSGCGFHTRSSTNRTDTVRVFSTNPACFWLSIMRFTTWCLHTVFSDRSVCGW